MKPVLQTRFGKGEGNCLNACVASILALPLGGPGGVAESHDFLRAWLFERDLGIVWVTRQPGTVTLAGAGSYYIGSGESPRDPAIDHAIVMSEGKEAHDPHPSGAFLRGFVKEWGFIVRLGIADELRPA